MLFRSGIIDAEQCKVILSIPYKTENLKLSECKETQIGLPFLIENDANCLGWLQLIRNKTEHHRDFLVVLAENHDSPAQKDEHLGIGVGISLTFENKVRYGTQYGAGEFITTPWKPENPGQTSLSLNEIDNIFKSPKVYRKWATEIFSTLTPIISILAPDIVFVHGQTPEQRQILEEITQNEMPQLSEILRRNGSRIEFVANDEFEVAEGAAAMLLQKLFSVPDISEIDTKTRFDWDAIFTLAKK